MISYSLNHINTFSSPNATLLSLIVYKSKFSHVCLQCEKQYLIFFKFNAVRDRTLFIASARETVDHGNLIDNNTHKDLELCEELVR